jgi:hypothetical protein
MRSETLGLSVLAEGFVLSTSTVVLAIVCIYRFRHGRRPWLWGIVGGYNVVLLALYSASVLLNDWGYVQLALAVALFLLTLPWSIVLNGPAESALNAIPAAKSVIGTWEPGLFMIVGVFGGINSLGMYLYFRWALYTRNGAKTSLARAAPLALGRPEAPNEYERNHGADGAGGGDVDGEERLE